MQTSGSFPKVSIIMPTYNRQALINETIQSIRSQTYTNWELIVVDDGSDDQTEEVIRQIKDERIRFYKAGRVGVNGKIKNLGLKKVTGQLIAFIDSDDLWASSKLEKQVAALAQYPDAGFSLTGGYDFKILGQPLGQFYKQKEGIRYGHVFNSFFLSEVAGTMPTLMLRRECLERTGEFEEDKAFTDVDFILTLAWNFNAIILYEPLFYRRIHNNNYSSANWEENYKQGIDTVRKYKRKKMLPASIARNSLFKSYVNFGEDYLSRKKTRKAIVQFIRAWKSKPLSIIPLKKTAKAILHHYKKSDIPSKPWKKKSMPRRILAIRLQAMGDLVITLPYLQQLRKSLPSGSRLDLLTREEVELIPKNIELFDKVYSIRGGRNVKKQFIHVSWLLPFLMARRYEVVIDLQNNIVTHYVRKALMPKAWSVFDRFSPIPAGESTRLTIKSAGLGECFPESRFKLKNEDDANEILKANGWKDQNQLVVLNPAGAFSTRNWPIENYVGFAKQWLTRFPNTQFLVIGVNQILEKAAFLKTELGSSLINLVNKTNPVQAFSIIQQVNFVLSEDSGLMHMAWVSGIPTLALFGSTRSDRARPLGKHSLLLHSSDLPCGNCMLEICAYGDNHCLTRYSPQFVFEQAVNLYLG